MALINCYECNAEISDQAAACPKCGAAQTKRAKASAAKAVKAKERQEFAKSPKGKRQQRIGLLATMVIVAGLLWTCSSSNKPTRQDTSQTSAATPAKPAAPAAMKSIDALFMCQKAFKLIAKDPEKANIPYVPDMGSGSESYFAWGGSTKMMRMRNGLGLEVATSGSCIVDRNARRITSLTLDGKSIL